MNTNNRKIYKNKNKTERSLSFYESESIRISVARRLVELAASESRALLSLYRQYAEILAGTVISNDTASVVSDVYSKLADLEHQLRAAIRTFYEYSQELPDPWKMIPGYSIMWRDFQSTRKMLDEAQCK